MNSVEQIRKLNQKEIIILITGFLSTIAPGTLILCLFSRDLFLELSSFKLILLSLAICLPWIIVNAVFSFCVQFRHVNESTETILSTAIFNAALLSSLILYFSILISLVFGKNELFLFTLSAVINFIILAIATPAYSKYLAKAAAFNKLNQAGTSQSDAPV